MIAAVPRVHDVVPLGLLFASSCSNSSDTVGGTQAEDPQNPVALVTAEQRGLRPDDGVADDPLDEALHQLAAG
jgi:hypothetical protein